MGAHPSKIPVNVTCHRLQTHGETPLPREGHAAVAVDQSRMLVFGGGSLGGRPGSDAKQLADTHMLDIATGLWTRLSTRGTAPCARTGHAMVPIDHGARVLVFGGCSATEGYLSDLHALDVAACEWSAPAVSGCGPSPRDKMAACSLYVPGTAEQLAASGFSKDALAFLGGPGWKLLIHGGFGPVDEDPGRDAGGAAGQDGDRPAEDSHQGGAGSSGGEGKQTVGDVCDDDNGNEGLDKGGDGEGSGDSTDGEEEGDDDGVEEEGEEEGEQGPSQTFTWFADAYCLDVGTMTWRRLPGSHCPSATQGAGGKVGKKAGWDVPTARAAHAAVTVPTCRAVADAGPSGSGGQPSSTSRVPAMAAAGSAADASRAAAVPGASSQASPGLLSGGKAGAAGGPAMLVFGGRDCDGRQNDLYSLDLRTLEWRREAPVDPESKEGQAYAPPGRAFHAMGALGLAPGGVLPSCSGGDVSGAGDGQDMACPPVVLFGGLDMAGKALADLNVLCSKDFTWATPGELAGDWPSARGACSLCVMGEQWQTLVVYGGSATCSGGPSAPAASVDGGVYCINGGTLAAHYRQGMKAAV